MSSADRRKPEKLRLGGMALQNGVLIHGPTAWAVAIRDDDGEVRVATGSKRRLAARVNVPVLRGPLRLTEAFALLPDIKRRFPAARFPFERPIVAVAVVTSSVAATALRRAGMPAPMREALAAFASLVPAVVALRGGELSSYHGAEHVAVGTYERDAPAAKEHERCGSHLIGPLLLAGAAANAIATRVPLRRRRAARLAGSVVALGTAVEVFAWAGRHPGSLGARVLAVPGHRLQRHLATSEPTPAQLEVAQAALTACLEAEAREGR